MLINVSSSSSSNVKKVKGVIPPSPIFPTVVYSTAPGSPAGIHPPTENTIERAYETASQKQRSAKERAAEVAIRHAGTQSKGFPPPASVARVSQQDTQPFPLFPPCVSLASQFAPKPEVVPLL